jgi:hypothetical protein
MCIVKSNNAVQILPGGGVNKPLMLNGNEEPFQIYAYVLHTHSLRLVYKELVKFRRRANYFELLGFFLQKALGYGSHSTDDVDNWCVDTLEWLRKRDASLWGVKSQRAADELEADLSDPSKSAAPQTKSILTKKNKIKKYKLLIPLDLNDEERTNLEERQKKAIDSLNEHLLLMYQIWQKRKKLRRFYQEESPFKSQFYSIWALNNFVSLMNKLKEQEQQERSTFAAYLHDSSHIDPQQFLLDVNCVLLAENSSNSSNINNNNSISKTVTKPNTNQSETRSLKGKSMGHRHAANVTKSLNRIVDGHDRDQSQANKAAEVLCQTLSGVCMDGTDSRAHSPLKSTLSQADILSYLSDNVFARFRKALTFAHRGKQWIQLQNICKLILNCLSTLLIEITTSAASRAQQRPPKTIKISHLWKVLCSCMHFGSDYLLDMLILATPIKVELFWIEFFNFIICFIYMVKIQ